MSKYELKLKIKLKKYVFKNLVLITEILMSYYYLQ